MPIPDVAPIQNPYGPLITFKTEDILPPSAIYVGPQDSIVIQSLTPTVAATIVIAYRLLRPDGTLISTTDQFSFSAGAGYDNWFVIQPSEGFLLSMCVFSATATRGQSFVRGYITNNPLGTHGIPAHMFCQGYVGQCDVLTFPQPSVQSSLDGRGWTHEVSIYVAAGANGIWTVPANVHWRIVTIAFAYGASATVANRNLTIQIKSDTNRPCGTYFLPQVVTANGYIVSAAAPGLATQGNASYQTIGFPMDLHLRPNWTVTVSSNNWQAGDYLEALVMTVEEFVGV